ncbi:hypothetical protein EII42_09465 [Tessaracoccus sp. OH4464_COT-324]|nr:hypothetical protein EII42_09465 [Tessaracoccus sp. OH4464_COT-324]
MVLSHFSIRRLLVASLKVGATGFGGGSALIPVMHREYVQRHKLLGEDVFTAHTVVANITPGALPVKLAALAGTQSRRIWASLVAACAVALPGALATVLLLALFTAIGPSAIRVVEFMAVGISVFIMVLLLHYISKVLHASRPMVAVPIILAAFLATGTNQLVRAAGTLVGAHWAAAVPQLSAVQLVLVALAGAAVFSLLPWGRGHLATADVTPGRTLAPAALFAGVALAVLGLGFVLGHGHFLSLIGFSTVTSFGGGEAYVGVADGFFVATGTVSSAEFYGQAVPIANALPGPILVKIASALGYSYGTASGGWGVGVLLAGLAFLLSIAACSAVALLFMAGYDKASRSAFVRNLGQVILPVICGLLISTMLSMLNASMEIAERAAVSPATVGWVSLAGVAALWVVHRSGRLPDLVLLAIAGGVSLGALLLVA